jgi:hypothetical protein
MWESLSGGEDPTADDHPAGTAPGGRPGAVLARGDDQSPGMGAPAPMSPGEPPAG